ncbi:alanine/glycine:cation symporter family protein [Brumimicrobium aurantiacum]|uniref:Alanine:cation symporter family protein n=1 Tax=Brumimicrobium aurantiacum TaxID=1737063 RepID=A0A3E1EY40_9FLAO|nr:alanine/glycine:cation symporter family protein [Brumimicrobium aurantiacum]RFC54471.1 alanine:cation symporter family protein [Brumimicrobium aurantiacum]
MRLAKILATIFLLSNFAFSQDKPLSAEISTNDQSQAIDDVEVIIEAEGGERPYKYVWNDENISIYNDKYSGWSEGDSVIVTVIDAKDDSVTVRAFVEPNSFSEHVNNTMKPAVNVLQTILFAEPWSDTVKVNDFVLKAPFAINAEKTNYTLKKWLKEDGEQVEHLEPVAILKDGDKEFPFYAMGNGTLVYGTHEGQKVKEGDKVYFKNKRGNRSEKVLGKIDYAAPQPFYFKNLSNKSQGIPLIVVWLVCGAIFFTIRMKFIQFRGVRHAIDLVRGRYDDPNEHAGEVTHFQALVTALSATVGLGNIAGVAIAISMGGPGATFWMILAGLIGMASKFVECTLGVKYRHQKEDGEVFGGPMYYLSRGLEKRGPGFKQLGKVLAILFAILCVGGSLGGGNMFQVNQAFNQLAEIPGWEGFSSYGLYFGIGMAILVGIVIVGGIKSIAKVTDKIVPTMVGIYVVSALVIIGFNYDNLGHGFSTIISGAFSPDAMYGGFIGVLILGFQRAAFSNEAGVGSAPIAHAAAKTDEPVSEGVVAILEPFIDTVVVCTMTALVIIFTGYAQDPEGLEGAALTSAAFSSSLGDWSLYVLSFAVVLFAFSTMISWSYYGLKAWTYVFGETKVSALIYKFIFLIFVVIGASVGLGAVIDFSDLMILGMAFPNILGLLIMSGEVKNDLKDYFSRIKSGAIKRFK